MKCSKCGQHRKYGHIYNDTILCIGCLNQFEKLNVNLNHLLCYLDYVKMLESQQALQLQQELIQLDKINVKIKEKWMKEEHDRKSS